MGITSEPIEHWNIWTIRVLSSKKPAKKKKKHWTTWKPGVLEGDVPLEFLAFPCVSKFSWMVFKNILEGGLQSVVTSRPQGSVSPSWAGWAHRNKTQESPAQIGCSLELLGPKNLFVYEERNHAWSINTTPSTCRNGGEQLCIAFLNILCACRYVYTRTYMHASRCWFSKKKS